MVNKNESLSFEKTVIKEYIETLDDIKVKYMPRSQYVFLGGNILKAGILYLPDDLEQSDFLIIVKHIHNYYNINSETIDIVKNKTKVLSSILLKIGGADSLPLKEIPYSQVKNVLKEVKAITSKKLGDFDELDKVIISRYLQNYLNKEFFKELYQVGNQNLKRNLKTLTREEKERIEERKSLKKNGEFIKFKGVHDYFDIEQDFRDFVGIDDMRAAICEIQKKGNTQELPIYLKQCVDKIFDAMNLFPYQSTKENNGYKVKGILLNKEIYCVGFTLILHSLLEDLGIDHVGVDIQNHVATKVNIGDVSYLFDNVMLGKLEIFQAQNAGGEYSYFPLIEDYGKTGEITDVIVAKILLNTGCDLSIDGKINESIYAFEKSYTFFKSFDTLLNIARAYRIQENYQKGVEICQRIQSEFGELFPEMKDSLHEVRADNLYGLKDYKHAMELYQNIDASMNLGTNAKIGDCLFYLGDIEGSLKRYMEEIRYVRTQKTLRNLRLKVYLLKKLLNIKTFFNFRYKREKRWIDQNIERQDIYELVGEF